jgi:hypothetical protein
VRVVRKMIADDPSACGIAFSIPCFQLRSLTLGVAGYSVSSLHKPEVNPATWSSIREVGKESSPSDWMPRMTADPRHRLLLPIRIYKRSTGGETGCNRFHCPTAS